MALFKVYKISELPPALEANSVYFVENPNDEENLDIYVTDKTGATARSALRKEIVEEMIDTTKEELIELVASTAIVIPATKQDDKIYPSYPIFWSPYVNMYGLLSPIVVESPVVVGVNSVFFPITFLNKININRVLFWCSVYLDGTIVEDVASLQVKIREYKEDGLVGDTLIQSDTISISTSDTENTTEERIFTLPDDIELNGNYWVEIICNYTNPINANYTFNVLCDEPTQYAQYFIISEDGYYLSRVGYIANTGATQVPDTNVDMGALRIIPDETLIGLSAQEYSFFIYFKYEEA